MRLVCYDYIEIFGQLTGNITEIEVVSKFPVRNTIHIAENAAYVLVAEPVLAFSVSAHSELAMTLSSTLTFPFSTDFIFLLFLYTIVQKLPRFSIWNELT